MKDADDKKNEEDRKEFAANEEDDYEGEGFLLGLWIICSADVACDFFGKEVDDDDDVVVAD